MASAIPACLCYTLVIRMDTSYALICLRNQYHYSIGIFILQAIRLLCLLPRLGLGIERFSHSILTATPLILASIASSVRLPQPVFSSILCMWFFTVLSDMCSLCAIFELEKPFVIARSTSSSLSVNSVL